MIVPAIQVLLSMAPATVSLFGRSGMGATIDALSNGPANNIRSGGASDSVLTPPNQNGSAILPGAGAVRRIFRRDGYLLAKLPRLHFLPARSLSNLPLSITSSAKNLIAIEGICLDRHLEQSSALRAWGISFDCPPQRDGFGSLSVGVVCIAADITSMLRTSG